MTGVAKKRHSREMEAEMSSTNQRSKGPLYSLKSYVCFKKLFFLKGRTNSTSAGTGLQYLNPLLFYSSVSKKLGIRIKIANVSIPTFRETLK